ncbi:S-adenosyl-L-methionine-dependent methyltransferase [Panus rudis PR-1116 ss-1]|nr:S-adenosyl-L-methionine-dependent methyltransferase [Panus rudis PR-1116 ss-1]
MNDPLTLSSATAAFYSSHPSLEDRRLKLHRIEFEVTLRTILDILTATERAKVLDVGGATGTYSFPLAAKGHDVTLVDLSPGLISVAASRAEEDPDGPRPSRIMVGDALSLDTLLPGEEGTFDVVLLLGPLYHIMSPELRERAIRQAWRMVAQGGSLFCAWVSRWAHYRDLAMREPQRLFRRKDFYAKHAQNGDYVRTDEDNVPIHAMHHEIPSQMPIILRRVTGVQNVKMVGAEGILAGNLDKPVNDLEGEEFEAWVHKCMDIGHDENEWMMSDHIIGIAQKASQ